MNERIIFFDIDNTLVDHFENKVQDSTIVALKKLIDNNHNIVICTGKPPSYIAQLELLLEIKIDNYICLNGNYIVYNSNVVYQLKIPSNVLKSFTNYCITNDISFSLMNELGIHTIYEDSLIIKDYYNYFNAPYPKLIDNIDYEAYHQISLMHNPLEIDIIQAIYQEFDFIKMNDYGMNIVLKTSGKGNGILKYLEFSKQDINNTICFGDGLNDIEMFKVVNISVAMGNADSILKEYATIITDHISNDGLYNACLKLGLIA